MLPVGSNRHLTSILAGGVSVAELFSAEYPVGRVTVTEQSVIVQEIARICTLVRSGIESVGVRRPRPFSTHHTVVIRTAGGPTLIRALSKANADALRAVLR
jgi:hypothetical protein